MAVVATSLALGRTVYTKGQVVPDELATPERVKLRWFVVDDDDAVVETSTAEPGSKRATKRRNSVKRED
jgi:hypothetical protein